MLRPLGIQAGPQNAGISYGLDTLLCLYFNWLYSGYTCLSSDRAKVSATKYM